LSGQLAAAPLPAGAAPPLPLADALADAPPPVDALADALPPPAGALGATEPAALSLALPPALPDGVVVVPPVLPPHAANTMLNIMSTLIEPHLCLNRTFIVCFLL
jgi:hypothetical protein